MSKGKDGAIVAIAAALIAAAATVAAAYIGKDHRDDSVTSTPSADGNGSPPPQSPAPPTSAQKPAVVVSDCKGPQSTARGATIQVTYTVTSTTEILVSIGAALYDEAGDDHSNGNGDQDNYKLNPGVNNISRPVAIPSTIGRGDYELAAEIWPNNQIGSGETLSDKSCGTIHIT